MRNKFFFTIYTFLLLGSVISQVPFGNGYRETTKTTPRNPQNLISPIVSSFDFDLLNSLEYEYDATSLGQISHLEGHNIASGDYLITANSIIILRDYLAYLEVGNYTFEVYAYLGKTTLSLSVIDRDNAYRLVNPSLETGDLFAWTPVTTFKAETNLQAFITSAIVSNEQIKTSALMYHGSGDYVFGLETSTTQQAIEERMGRLISSSFILGGTGYLTFKLGAMKNADLTYLSVRRATNHQELARYSNHLFNGTNPLDGSYNGEALNAYRADLSAYLGETLYLEFVDIGVGAWDLITFDAIETYHVAIPTGTDAINTHVLFPFDYAPNQVPNGSFNSDLANWTPSSVTGWQKADGSHNTFNVVNGSLRSDASGDSARGLIRSLPFRVDGSGFMSLDLGAGKGDKFDKNTFVSVRLVATNQEVLRFANNRHNGTTLIRYFADLNAYMGETLYFEIVDNGTSDWDTIFVDNIVTFYPVRPAITFADLIVNLAY